MAQNYTRQSTLSDGDTITASLFNDEYNQLVNAFAYSSTSASSTGHRHDGSAGQGGNIFKIGDLDFLNKIEVDSTNNRWGFYVEVSSAAVEQIRIQDGAVVPVTTNDIDLGTASLQFKDLYIDGTANVDSLTLTSGATVTTILDEDDLSSDSATALVTQQSVKAYVDSQVTAQDLDFQADTGGALSIDLDSETLTFTGGTGIDTSGSGNAVTFAIDSTVATLTGTQTLTNKTLTSPDVNTPDIDGGTIDGTVIGGTTAAAGSFTTVSATGNITVGGTVDGRDVATDGTKLDGIEASADVTDTANVTAAGALMDSELTSEASVKALNQGVATTDSPTFAGVTVSGDANFDSGTLFVDVSADKVGVGTTSPSATLHAYHATDDTVLKVESGDGQSRIDLIDSGGTARVSSVGSDLRLEADPGNSVANSAIDFKVDGTQVMRIDDSFNVGIGTTSPSAKLDVAGTVEFDGLSGTGSVTVTDILDQDDMSSDSATALATQQSIKAYVDSQVATVDTLAEVLGNGNTTGGTDIAVGTGDDVTFADNSKAIFGAGSDLQIYHDGSNSYIDEVGTGDLVVLSSTRVRFEGKTTGDTYMRLNENSSVQLYHDNTVRLTTTSTGIDVTGTVTADDSITLAATPTSLDENRLIFNETPAAGSLGSRILWRNPSTGYDYASVGFTNEAGSSGGLRFKTASSVFSDSDALRMKIADNGDISFYEDTGTTAKLFWDASTERLGVGTITPNAPVDAQLSGIGGLPVSSGTSQTYGSLRVGATSFNTILDMGTAGGTGAWLQASDRTGLGTNYSLLLNPNGGNVGIGTSSPSEKLHVAGALRVANNSADTYLGFGSNSDNYISTASGGATIFRELSTERMRIDSSGNVGIGTSSPEETLSVMGDFQVALNTSVTGRGLKVSTSNTSITDDTVAFNAQASTGILAFQTNSSERMRIDSSGNVGIGTTDPSTRLSVRAGSANGIELDQDSDLATDSARLFFNSSSGGYSVFNTSGSLRFNSGATAGSSSGTERMRIDSSGNVGIGRTPVTYGTYQVLDVAGTTGAIQKIIHTGNNVQLQAYASSTVGVLGTATSHDLLFVTGDGERMRIDSSGRVGIGTSSPSQKLDVSGNISMSGAGTGSRYVILGNETDTYAGSLVMQAGAGSAAYGGSIIAYGHSHASKPGDIVAGISSGSGGSFRVNTSGIDNGADVFVVEAGGNVGIGTSSPDTSLHISESSTATATVRLEQTDTTLVADQAVGVIEFEQNDAAGAGVPAKFGAFAENANAAVGLRFYTGTGATANERMRIDADGQVIVNNSGGDAQINFGGISGADRMYVGRAGNDAFLWNVDTGVLKFGNNNSEAMRIDSSGNVGIGTTGYGTYSSGDRVLSLGSGTTIRGAVSGAPYLTAVSNGYFDGTNWKYAQTHPASNYEQYNGIHTFSYAASGTAGNNITFSEAMRIDASGNLLVGQTSASSGTVGTSLRSDGRTFFCADGNYSAHFNRNTSDGAIAHFAKDDTIVGSIGVNSGYFYVGGTAGNDAFLSFGADGVRPSTSAGAARDAAIDLGGSSNRFKDLYLSGTAYLSKAIDEATLPSTPANHAITLYPPITTARYGGGISWSEGTNTAASINAVDAGSGGALHLAFSTGSNSAIAERMRLDTTGNLLVGCTALPTGSVSGFGFTADQLYTATTSTSANTQVRFYNGNGLVGNITTDGSATAFNTSSDQRLKENIVDAPSASDDIDAIQVRSFDWKVDGSHQKYGMVAQELQSVAPEAVSGDADSDEMMGVDYSKLVPMLVKEIQSLRARVAQLEGAN